MIFRNSKHKERYLNYISRCERKNCETKAMTYLLALVCDNICHAEHCFNFEELLIKPDGLSAVWQTGTSTRAIKLAFNLWNGYEAEKADSYKIFGTAVDKYFCEAIKIRFGF